MDSKLFDIKAITYEIRETTYRLQDYLKEKHPEWLEYKKEIEKAIHDAQEIGQCDNCDYWTDLGELNEQSECEGVIQWMITNPFKEKETWQRPECINTIMQNNTNPIIIAFNNKYIVRDRIIAMYVKEYKVFPYFKPFQSFCWVWRYPFIKQYSFPLNIWITRWCVEVMLDNGKIFRQWHYNEGHRGGYGSHTNAESALVNLNRNFQYVSAYANS